MKDATSREKQMRKTEPPRGAEQTTDLRRETEIPEIDVRVLVAGGREAVIVHAGVRYRLRITANDKLLLTK
jgi:hemin uptake protein HemP